MAVRVGRAPDHDTLDHRRPRATTNGRRASRPVASFPQRGMMPMVPCFAKSCWRPSTVGVLGLFSVGLVNIIIGVWPR